MLRAAIGQVQQDVFIFTGDIKSNISLDNENISIEDVKRAAGDRARGFLYRKNAGRL